MFARLIVEFGSLAGSIVVIAILCVAIQTGRCFGAIGESLGVKALIVSRMRRGVEEVIRLNTEAARRGRDIPDIEARTGGRNKGTRRATAYVLPSLGVTGLAKGSDYPGLRQNRKGSKTRRIIRQDTASPHSGCARPYEVLGFDFPRRSSRAYKTCPDVRNSVP